MLRLLNVVEDFTREAIVILAERSNDADTTVNLLERLVAERDAAKHLRIAFR